MLDDLDNLNLATEALALVDTRFRAISSIEEIILKVYEDGPSLHIRRRMESYGWTIHAREPVEEEDWDGNSNDFDDDFYRDEYGSADDEYVDDYDIDNDTNMRCNASPDNPLVAYEELGYNGDEYTAECVLWSLYQQSKVSLPEAYPQLSSSPNTTNFLSSIAAGTAATVATNPIWTVKTRLMSQAYRPYAAYKMYMTEGMGAFYSGLRASLLGLSHVAIQFPAYEYLKTALTGRGMGASRSDSNTADWAGILSASLLSKIVASSMTYPHEVIRTRLQTQRRPVPGAEFLEGLGGFNGLRSIGVRSMLLQPKYRGVFHAFQVILREEGWRALYNGMGVNIARSVPAAMVTMLTYEYVMGSLSRLKDCAQRDDQDD
ncbi:hypothetical protein AK830_g8225 [Neonectria ditissima]|uniref:Uncharacterized protein n=1 Tax=Neonectria ditissima TaxID=78410 RepID=A0A0P7BD52_9HYPO|nr:hypothetical protein AK830_g8225 [Neonectria ditissima]